MPPRSCQTSKSHKIAANHRSITANTTTAPARSSRAASPVTGTGTTGNTGTGNRMHVNGRIRARKCFRTNPRRSTAVAIRNEDETFHPILYGLMDENDPDSLRFISAIHGSELRSAVTAGDDNLKQYFTIIEHEQYQVMMNEFCSNVWGYKSSGIDVKQHFRGCKLRCKLPDGVKTPKVFSLTKPSAGLAFHVKYVEQQRKKGKKDEKSMFIGQTPHKHRCRAYTRSLLALMNGCPAAADRVRTLQWNPELQQFISEKTIPPFIQQLIQQNATNASAGADAVEEDSVSGDASSVPDSENFMDEVDEDERDDEITSGADSEENEQKNTRDALPGRHVTFDSQVYIAPDLHSMNSDDNTAEFDEDRMSIDNDAAPSGFLALTPLQSPRVYGMDPFAVEDQPLSPSFSLPTPLPDDEQLEVSSQDSDDTFALAMRAPSFSSWNELSH